MPDETSLSNPNGSTGPKGIPIETLIQYRTKGLSLNEIAKLVGSSFNNVQKRLQDLSLESLEAFNDHKASIYDVVERKHLTKLVNEDSKNPMIDMTVAAIAGDKGRLIRGQSTAIVEVRQLTVDLDRALDRYLELKQVQGGAGGVDPN